MKSLILLLIAMSAAGTFPFIIYLALSIIFYNYISARFRYRCLKSVSYTHLIVFRIATSHSSSSDTSQFSTISF